MNRKLVYKKITELFENETVTSFASLVLAAVGMVIQGAALIEPGVQLITSVVKQKIPQSHDKHFEEEYGKELQGCIKDAITRLRIEAKETEYYYSPATLSAVEALLKGDVLKPGHTSDEFAALLIKRELKLTEAQISNARVMYHEAIRKSLFFYPRLNAYLLSIALDSLEEDIKNQDKSHLLYLTSSQKAYDMFLENEFIHKLRVFSAQDGMMQAMSVLFSQHFMDFSTEARTIRCLSQVQDYYNFDYAKYNSDPGGKNIHSSKSKFTLDLIERNEIYQQSIPLFECYLNFVQADFWYFNKQYATAVEAYEKVEKELEKLEGSYDSENIESAMLYIKNSIGWAFRCAEVEEQVKPSNKAIEIFQDVFGNEIAHYPGNPFVSIYRRNYGVCLENKGRYVEALKQYEIALSESNRTSAQYKLYITYCSAWMKLWDTRYFKVTIEWLENVKAANNSDKWSISKDSLRRINDFLFIAERKKGDFADIYVQRAKALIYEMLYNTVINKSEQFAAIEQQLFYAEQFSLANQIGHLFVRRDMYYALFLMNHDNNRNEWLHLCKRVNDQLAGRGDSVKFARLLASIT